MQVRVREQNLLPTIWINDSYLLTLTKQDVFPGSTPQEQAEIWAGKIQESVNLALQERSAEFLSRKLLEIAVIVAFAIALQWLLGFFWKRYLHDGLQILLRRIPAWEENRETQEFELLLSTIQVAIASCLWGATAIYIINQFPTTRQFGYRLAGTLVSTLTHPIITLGNNSYSIPDIALLLMTLWGVIVGAGALTSLLRSRLLVVTGMNRGSREAIAVVIQYALIFLGTIVLLQVWGLDLSSLTILASAFGVGIGLGFQEIAKNFASGIVLLFERPIQVGDFIEVGNYQGTVERIGARSTVIRTLDRVSIIVPNSRFLGGELINWDHDNPVSGLRLPVGVAYGSDVDAVRKTLLEAAGAVYPDVLKVPPTQVLFLGFGDSSLDFELRVWISQPNKQATIKSELYFKIESLFRDRNIEIPFPQRDLHLRSGNLPVGLSPELEAMLLELLKRQKSTGKILNSQKE